MAMENNLMNIPLISEQEDSKSSPENSDDSPCATMFNDSKMASTSSPKRSSRRGIQKRVISVPIKDVDLSRLKGEITSPPSDSWSWRKYGQKPIKGSPYPRGYYKCSTSKGCPARKQVERSRDNPSMLVVTYSCEHNHPWPAARNNHHHHNRHNTTTATTATTPTTSTRKINVIESKSEENQAANISTRKEENCDEKFGNLCEASSLVSGNDEFGIWFTDFECNTSSTILESTTLILNEERASDVEMNMFCSMREEEKLLFADLGELPGCSMVFHQGIVKSDEELHQHSLTSWCGTTG